MSDATAYAIAPFLPTVLVILVAGIGAACVWKVSTWLHRPKPRR